MSKVVIIQGHPDPSGKRLCHALAKAYRESAIAAGHQVELFDCATIDFPILRTQEDWKKGPETTPQNLKASQAACTSADHLVIIYPLWFGTMPALLKAYIEQTFRPGVAVSYEGGFPKGLFKGKSARIIITMGMPALIYRLYFFSHSLRSLERNILNLCGIKPVRNTIIGMVENTNPDQQKKWFDKIKKLGAKAI